MISVSRILIDLIIFSKNELKHSHRLERVFDSLQNSNLCLNEGERKFFRRELVILGNWVEEGEIKSDPSKKKQYKHMNHHNYERNRSFLGLINFCLEYLPALANDAGPLTI